ncbi:acyltransferase [Vibrio sp. 404]|uniref:Acyltransferase n=1 Tax=Vibrio marinisediminis TaxID=2758441 RepID=A0A7W2FSQ6_9VIBR|nr:acyltransferase [Vibrio marinisediminis]MBA5763546.1 acyltransferase [Vibrio marinisediminis]
MSVATLKIWLQNHPNPRYRSLFHWLKRTRAQGIPTPRWFNVGLGYLYQSSTTLWQTLLRLLIHTPVFKGRLMQCGKRLYLYGGVPYIAGPLTIVVGDDCRISGQTTFTGRTQSASPCLEIGNNVDVGWQSTFAIGQRIVLQDNVRIAGRAFLFGYSGHSLDAEQRAIGAPDDDSDVGDIIIKRNAWLGTNVTVCPNVTIGEGTVVGSGSVVTRDLPDFVVAVGNPARVVRNLKEQPDA